MTFAEDLYLGRLRCRSARELPIAQSNLGLLDQELGLKWVQMNIAKFSGDPDKVTIMVGPICGLRVCEIVPAQRSEPVSCSLEAPTSFSEPPSFSSFDAFASAVGCTQPPGPARPDCLRRFPVSTIGNFMNGPLSNLFAPIVDNVTVFSNPLERIRSSSTVKVPIVLGNMENDGSVSAVGMSNLTAFLESEIPGSISPAVWALYPGQNDSLVISDSLRDMAFRCPDELWSAALTDTGARSSRTYKNSPAREHDIRLNVCLLYFGPLFGTFNRSTATPAEVTWSSAFQTVIFNFVKNPNVSLAVNWPKYIPEPPAKTFTKLAYRGNVDPDNFVDPVESTSLDGPCDALWDRLSDCIA
ncbi:Alpha/Beta hydrolase protein [Mycena epipterygia]|nr:Alpha/Beta hydrolase protein [Mycena epipterygia]